MDILTYVETAPEDTAFAVIHYCIRALDQAGLSEEQRRDIFFDGPSNPPTMDSISLTRKILAAIEEAEHMRIEDLDRKTAEAYIRNAADAMDTLITRMEGYDEINGEELLQKIQTASLTTL